MIYDLLFIVLAIIGVFSYLSKTYSRFIVILFLILSSGFGFIPSPLLKLHDISFVMCFGSAIFASFSSKTIFTAKNDIVAKIIYALLGWYTLVAALTIILGNETILFTLKIWRLELFYLTYFTFRQIPRNSLEKAFKPLLILTVISGIFYLLQFVGITGFLNENVDENIGQAIKFSRFRNASNLSLVFLYYLIYTKKNIELRYVYLLILSAVIVFQLSRGLIVSIVGSILLYQIVRGQISKLIRVSLLGSLLFLLFLPVIQYRFASQEGTSEDVGFIGGIKNGLSMLGTEDFDKDDIDGTFTFRIALALERWNFLKENTQYLWTGVGSIHEESPNNKFIFDIGTYNERYEYGKGMINTTDISYVSHVFRYGLVYLIIFLLFLYYSIRRLYSCKNNIFALVGFLVLTQMIIQSLGSDRFSRFILMAMPLLLIAQTAKINGKKMHRSYNTQL
nr:hypothetical protein [uncultured Marinifilum sp.]